MQELPELLLIDKPSGMSSFDVIRVLRRTTGIRKFGHAGTLDPLATGLMLIGVEKGTKALTDLTKLDKEYIAEVRFGERRTTGDLEGEVIESAHVASLEHDVVAEAITHLIGSAVYPVSAYSAKKRWRSSMRPLPASKTLPPSIPRSIGNSRLPSLGTTDHPKRMTILSFAFSIAYQRNPMSVLPLPNTHPLVSCAMPEVQQALQAFLQVLHPGIECTCHLLHRSVRARRRILPL